MTPPLPQYDLDQLVVDLRRRIASPADRTDHPVSRFAHQKRGMDAASMMDQARELSALASGIVDTATADPLKQMEQARAHKLAEQLRADMQTVADVPREPRASDEDLAAAELALGLKLPDSMRRLYRDVANGGFGPCRGLLPLSRIVSETMHMRSAQDEGFPFAWPADLIAIEASSPYAHCLDTRTGQIVAMNGDAEAALDWDQASEVEQRAAWHGSFEVVAPNLESWLGAWIAGPDPSEVAAHEAVVTATMAEAAAHWRALVEQGVTEVGKKRPGERRAMGLPDSGWEDEMRRGAGLPHSD